MQLEYTMGFILLTKLAQYQHSNAKGYIAPSQLNSEMIPEIRPNPLMLPDYSIPAGN